MDFPSADAPSRDDFTALSLALAAIQPMGPFTVATLPTPGPDNLYRLATVTDLFGQRATRMRCERVVTGGGDRYYWQPSSSDSYGDVDVSSGNAIIGALTMPSSLGLLGNIAVSIARTVTLDPGAFPGQTKEVRAGGLIGALASLTILGVGLGGGLSLLAGGYAKYASDWTSGSPVWKRIA